MANMKPRFLLATALCAILAIGATLLAGVEAQQMPQEPRNQQATTAEQGWANCTIQLGRLSDTGMVANAHIAVLEKQLADEKSHLEWVMKNWVTGPAKTTAPEIKK